MFYGYVPIFVGREQIFVSVMASIFHYSYCDAVLHDFVKWCDQSYLCLNVTKTKDMCIDFRRDSPPQTDTVIHDNKVEVVDDCKYGTTIDNKFRWDRHCTVKYKKCQQRLYCLRKLRSFNVDNTVLSVF